ncbi:MAG: hypothetical protein LBC20_09630 [Planctomycetaceae bacterium]|jgi:hypothetical protein|nr:hypothetical protein [Planctomycetaceae bacterium]
MSNTLHIIIDHSGSMRELGKHFIVANLVRYVQDVCIIQPERFEPLNLKLLICNDTVNEIAVSPNQDIELPQPNGKFNTEQYLQLLEKEQFLSVLFLSDQLEKEMFPHLEKLTNCRFAFVAVGVDAKLPPKSKVKHLSAFRSEDISAALDFVLHSVSANETPPSFISEIHSENNIAASNEDNWDT